MGWDVEGGTDRIDHAEIVHQGSTCISLTVAVVPGRFNYKFVQGPWKENNEEQGRD